MTAGVAAVPPVKGFLIQILMLIAINVPTMSFGLAVGWVSLASGDGADGAGDGSDGADGADGALVAAAAATFAAGLAGVPLGARALRAGRKPALIATSAAFVVCWSLTLGGGWCVAAGRLAAGAAGAAAWLVAPLYARETMSPCMHGAGAAGAVVAHNLGVLLMYAAADIGLHHRTVETCCVALSAAHCLLCLFLPESPAFLAAQGKHEEARASLACLQGAPPARVPAPAPRAASPPPPGTFQLLREMVSDVGRRRAFVIALVTVVGQESCGVLTLVQFAERVFALALGTGTVGGIGATSGGVGEVTGGAGEGALGSPARHALLLGVVQLVASVAGLVLVERVGRRRLLIAGAVGTGVSVAVAAAAAAARGRSGAAATTAAALAAAVAADSLALQPAPYALLTDIFTYKYRELAVLIITAAACAGNAAETLIFPIVARVAGLPASLALAAVATLALALYCILYVPETRGRKPTEIYAIIAPEGYKNDGNDKYDDDVGCEYGNGDGGNGREAESPRALGDVERGEIDASGKYTNKETEGLAGKKIESPHASSGVKREHETDLNGKHNNKENKGICSDKEIETAHVSNDVEHGNEVALNGKNKNKGDGGDKGTDTLSDALSASNDVKYGDEIDPYKKHQNEGNENSDKGKESPCASNDIERRDETNSNGKHENERDEGAGNKEGDKTNPNRNEANNESASTKPATFSHITNHDSNQPVYSSVNDSSDYGAVHEFNNDTNTADLKFEVESADKDTKSEANDNTYKLPLNSTLYVKTVTTVTDCSDPNIRMSSVTSSDVIHPKTSCDITNTSAVPLKTSHNEQCSLETQCTNL